MASMLETHPRIADEPYRVRFTDLGRYYLDVEIYGYALTTEWPEYLEIREDVLLKVMEIIEQSGTRLALPTEIHYVNADGASRSEAP